jgi:ABC-type phosphate/phosphonate transport system permease subunit
MRTWTPPPFIASARTRWALYIGALIYLVLAIGSVEINWARMVLGLERGWAFVQGFMYPDFSSRWGDIALGFQESLTMTVTSTALGVLLSIPVAVGASRNLAPTWIYLACRAFIAASRTLNEIIVAIFLVAMFGFGPFAGFLTLIFWTAMSLTLQPRFCGSSSLSSCSPNTPRVVSESTSNEHVLQPSTLAQAFTPLRVGGVHAVGLGLGLCHRRARAVQRHWLAHDAPRVVVCA